MRRVLRGGRVLARELKDLLLPAECAGCRAAGTGWCPRCGDELGRRLFADGPRVVRPDPCPPGLPMVWSASPYAGPLRAALVAYKDEGRRDLAGVLAPVLAWSLAAALADPGPAGRHAVLGHAAGAVLLVPVPSSPASVRRRGDAPLEALLGHALGAWARAGPAEGIGGLAVVPALALTRRVADQAGLDHEQRARNLRGAMVVRPSRAAVVRGHACVLVDDVLTTGATLVEAARALGRGGAASVRCATVATTERRHGR